MTYFSKVFYFSLIILLLSLLIYYHKNTNKITKTEIIQPKIAESIIHPIKYNSGWVKHNTQPTELVINTLSFITYNIWFDRHNWQNRIKALLDTFKHYSPDIICLQEVTINFYQLLLNDPFIQSTYIISGNLEHSYDVLILSKHNVNFTMVKFDSRMGRRLLIAIFLLKDSEKNVKNVKIATSHFESLHENYAYRKKQFKTSFEVLANSTSFLMGDFNFDKNFNKGEENNLDKGFKDSWGIWKDRYGLSDADGVTFQEADGEPAFILDRILFNDDKIFELDKFEIIGKDAIKTEINRQHPYGYVNTPSDHYGLFARFKINKL
jgi:tyrosyl-DNA phosphodiesterase 2